MPAKFFWAAFAKGGNMSMNPKICICCGEPMPEKDHGLSRNPNVCASCSSMADGMGEVVLEAFKYLADSAPPADSPAPQADPTPQPNVSMDWTAGRFLKHD